MRQPGQKAVTGRVASHTLDLFQTAGPHALYVPFKFNGQTGSGAWQRGRLTVLIPLVTPQADGMIF